MNKISLKLTKIGTYIPFSSDNYHLYVLGVFLSTDVAGTSGFECFYRWLQTFNQVAISGNLTGLNKIGNNVHMFIFFDNNLYKEHPEKYSLTIPVIELKLIIKEWYNILDIGHAYIIISEDNSKYSLVAADEPHKPAVVYSDFNSY